MTLFLCMSAIPKGLYFYSLSKSWAFIQFQSVKYGRLLSLNVNEIWLGWTEMKWEHGKLSPLIKKENSYQLLNTRSRFILLITH